MIAKNIYESIQSIEEGLKNITVRGSQKTMISIFK